MVSYAYDDSGYYCGMNECQIDPVRSKKEGTQIFLIPSKSTKIPVPEYSPGKERPRWTGTEWVIELLPETDTLEANKATRIQGSKADLADYLEAHPLQWTDGEYYSITAEKQAQLTSKIMAATMAQTLSKSYKLTWNSTGEVCREWTLTDLSDLAFAIDQRVTALVSYQQTKEVAMRNAQTQEELDAVVVNYETVTNE